MVSMRIKQFKRLIHLWHILEKKSVTEAALMSNVTQPAMSNILNQLRSDFNDSLLVRTGKSYTLTPKAETLKVKLDALMPEITNLWDTADFSPQEFKGKFNLSGVDMDYYLFAGVISDIQTLAPGLRFVLHTHDMTGKNAIESLKDGNIDLAFLAWELEGAGLYRKRLYQSEFACITTNRCNLQAEDMTLERYLEFEHGSTVVEQNPLSKINRALANNQSQRRIVLEVNNFSIMPSLVTKSDLLFTVPLPFAERLKEHYPIKVLPFPFESKSLDFYIYWHERQHKNPMHKWLRDKFVAEANVWSNKI